MALRDIAPKAPTHVLVVPERHVESLAGSADFTAAEAKEMLDFIAETARAEGLEDYRVIANVGPSAGQTIYHLHWHILGGRPLGAMG